MADVQPELIALGFIWYVAFLFSTTCHEAAHALAAKIGGDDTAFVGGQVSLNPVPHIQRERAVRSPVGAAASPASRLDGTRGSGDKLHADAYRGNDPASGLDLPLAPRQRRHWSRGFRYECPWGFLLPQSLARNV